MSAFAAYLLSKGGMNVRLNKNSIFYHCLLLSSSSVVLQLLGFGYRILLGRLAGAQAIAVYGLVMSAYNVVLSCTLTGVALSVSRIASGYQALGQGRSIVRLIRTALFLFLGLFCLLAIPFGLGREFFAQKVLGNPETAQALLLIVPCLFLTGFENVHKAFFYGTGQTFAPTISETLEMLCRIVGAAALFSAAKGLGQLSNGQAAALIVCGMILSEMVSASFLTILYRFRRRKLTGRDDVPLHKILGDIASVAVPVSAATLLGRLISSANMVLIPRVLMRAGAGYEAAMEEFGVLSGMTMPMLMLPSAFFSPLITVLSPRFSAGKALEDEAMIRRIDRDMAYEEELIALERDFWENHVLTKTPPPYVEADGDLILESLRRKLGPADKDAPPVLLGQTQFGQLFMLLSLQEQKKALLADVNKLEKDIKRLKGCSSREWEQAAPPCITALRRATP